jgi:DHA2 family multidrug resistance protein
LCSIRDQARLVQLAATVFTGVTIASTASYVWNRPGNVDLSLFKQKFYLPRLTAYGVTSSARGVCLLTQRLIFQWTPACSSSPARSSAITLAITGQFLIRYIDQRLLVAVGLVLSAVGTIQMAGLSLQADAWAIASPGIVAGIGMGLFFVPLTAVAFGSIPAQARRGCRSLCPDARYRLLDRHRRGELAVRPPGSGPLG